MSLEINKIKDVIWEVINGYLDIPLMFAEQKILIPEEGVFGTLKMITLPIQTGHDSMRPVGDKIVVEGQREMTLSINLFRSGSIQKLINLQSYMQTPFFRNKLAVLAKEKGVELVVVEATTIQDLTTLVQSDYEERANLDVMLRSVSSVIDSETGYMESVVIDGKYNRDKGDPNPIDDNLTIS